VQISVLDAIVVDAYFYESAVAERLTDANSKVLLLEKPENWGGNSYSYLDETTKSELYEYGTHLFRIKTEKIWNYLTIFSTRGLSSKRDLKQ
jgi:UDP-galactopyranose mutase